jgi:hypothetical protein
MMRGKRLARGLLLGLVLLAVAAGCAKQSEDVPGAGQEVFATPEQAATAVLDAIDADDEQAVLAIFGGEYRDRIITPDWAADREQRQAIAAAGRAKLAVKEDDGVVTLVFGDEDWPFPIPLLKQGDTWRFDTEEGLERIVDRRIGRNELAAIAIVHAYVDAQIEYALSDRDGDEVLEYAQRLSSSDGQQDGLYWEGGPDEEESPLGPLVKGAEAYLDPLHPGDPLRGYYFKILVRQGDHPPGGAYDYRINDNMLAGFALVAYPAEYGNTGIMTFVVNHRGVIQQSDIGPFEGMDAYDPDTTWTVVEGEDE